VRECGCGVVCVGVVGAQRSKEGKTRIKKPRVWGSGPIRCGLGWVGVVWRRVGVGVLGGGVCGGTEEAAGERVWGVWFVGSEIVDVLHLLVQ
jgi:hypothetical protein